jgi:hypothetical protein
MKFRFNRLLWLLWLLWPLWPLLAGCSVYESPARKFLENGNYTQLAAAGAVAPGDSGPTSGLGCVTVSGDPAQQNYDHNLWQWSWSPGLQQFVLCPIESRP